MIDKTRVIRVLIIIALVFFAGCGGGSTNDQPEIHVDIEGTVDDFDDPLGLLDGSVYPGSLIQGYYRPHTNTSPPDTSQPNSANYYDVIGHNDLVVRIGNYTFRSSASGLVQLTMVDDGTNADGSFDGWYVYAQKPDVEPEVVGDFTIFISLYDSTASALSSTALVTTPDLANWTESRIGISRSGSLFIAGELDSLIALE